MKNSEPNRMKRNHPDNTEGLQYYETLPHEMGHYPQYGCKAMNQGNYYGDHCQRFMAAGNAGVRACDPNTVAYNDPRISPEYYYRSRTPNICPNYQGTWKQMNNPVYYNEAIQASNMMGRSCPVNMMMDIRSPQCTEGNCNHTKILRNVIEFCQHGERNISSGRQTCPTHTHEQPAHVQPKHFPAQYPASVPHTPYYIQVSNYNKQQNNIGQQATPAQQMNMNQQSNLRQQPSSSNQQNMSQQYTAYPVQQFPTSHVKPQHSTTFPHQNTKSGSKISNQVNEGYQDGPRQSFSSNHHIPRYFQPQSNCGAYQLPCGYTQDKSSGKKHQKAKHSGSTSRNKSSNSLSGSNPCSASKHSMVNKRDQCSCEMPELNHEIMDPCIRDEPNERSPVTWLKSIGNKFLGVESDCHSRDKNRSRSQLQCFEKDLNSSSKRLSYGMKNSFSNMLDGQQSHGSKRGMGNRSHDHRRGEDKKCNSR